MGWRPPGRQEQDTIDVAHQKSETTSDKLVIAPVTTANAPPPSLVPEPAAPPSSASAITDTTPSGTYTPGATVITPGATVYQYRAPVVVYHAPDVMWNLSPSYTDRAHGQ